MNLRRFLITLFMFSSSLIFINDAEAGCARAKAELWVNNLITNKKVNLSDGFMYTCANLFRFHEGAKNEAISIRYWSCISNKGCDTFQNNYSAISLNHQEWLPGEITYSNYPNHLKDHILCVKQNSSVIEYCWRQGEYFEWEGQP